MSRVLTPYESTQLARHGSNGMTVSDTTPIEYVTGIAEFCGMEFSVTPAVLIPRVETEGLVEIALECVSEKMLQNESISIIDVGTGSGAVIVSLAKHLEEASLPINLEATDISHQALTVAKQNAIKLTSQAIHFHQTDLLENVSTGFDIITANLPYIPSEAVKVLDESVINYEPLIALDGGNDGFELIHQLLQSSVKHLKPHGNIILELDTSHTTTFFKDFEKDFTITFFNDCFDRHRFARLDLKN